MFGTAPPADRDDPAVRHGGHLLVLRGFCASYEAIPLDAALSIGTLTQTVLAHVGHVLTSRAADRRRRWSRCCSWPTSRWACSPGRPVAERVRDRLPGQDPAHPAASPPSRSACCPVRSAPSWTASSRARRGQHRSGGVSRGRGQVARRPRSPPPSGASRRARTGRSPRSPDVAAWLTVLSFSFLAPMTVDRLRGTFETLMTRVPEVIARPEAGSAVEVLGLAAAAPPVPRHRCCWPRRGSPSPAAPPRAG